MCLYVTLLPEHQNNATSLQFFLFLYICIQIQNVHGYSYYAVVYLMLRYVKESLSHFITTFTIGIQYFEKHKSIKGNKNEDILVIKMLVQIY